MQKQKSLEAVEAVNAGLVHVHTRTDLGKCTSRTDLLDTCTGHIKGHLEGI